MKTIAFVCPTNIYGGGEVYLTRIMQPFIDEPNEYSVYLFSPENAMLAHIPPTVQVIPIKNCDNLISKIKNILKIFLHSKKNKFDIIFLNNFNEFSWMFFIFPSRTPLVCCGHNNFSTFEDPLMQIIKKRDYTKLLKRPFQYIACKLALAKFSTYICVNRKSYRNVSKIASNRKLCYIPNGVDRLERRKHRFDEFTVFGRLSRLSPEKGNDFLIKSFCQSIKYNKNIRLIIAGDGPEYDNLNSLIHELDATSRIQLVGFQDREVFFSSIDVMISSSSYETSPLTILEAFSCKCPVVATDVGGVNELIEHLKNGILVPYNDIEAMDRAIQLIASNPDLSVSIAESAFVTYKERYTAISMTQQTKEVLEALI